MYVIRETLSAGMVEANSYSLKLNQAKLMPAWIKMLQKEGYKINPFLYIWMRIMIVVRSTARLIAFQILALACGTNHRKLPPERYAKLAGIKCVQNHTL
jgi:hypothetical protein